MLIEACKRIKTQIKRTGLACALLLFGAPQAWGEIFEAWVTAVPDGDTVWVQAVKTSQRTKLRLQGMDAPESCQPGGNASAQALRQLLLRQVVTVELLGQDDYKRGLARLRYQNKDVGALMVTQGHAWSYRYKSDPGPYVREEEIARRLRRGVFAQTRPERPYDFRRRHGPC